MHVDLRGLHIRVPEQLLQCPDIRPALRKVRREGVAQSVARYPLRDTGLLRRPADRLAIHFRMQVMPTYDPALRSLG